MTDDIQTAKTGWSSVQVYVLSAICLLIGITTGYLFRGSTSQASSAPAPAAVQGQAPNSGLGNEQPTPEAMKRMADKQVAPLLEQLKSDPNDPAILAKVAHYYVAAGQFNDAATYYEKAAAVKPSAQVLTDLSNAYYYGGSADKAMETLNRALKLDPNFADALYNLGMLKWRIQGDAKGAIACWEKVLHTKLDAPHRAQVEKMIARAKEHAKMSPGTKTDKPAM
jgi:cytochrome c-type biogenesis protein CcmH/NrfG